MRYLSATLVLTVASADMYDVLMPHYEPPAACANGCASWSSLPNATLALWAAKSPPANASNHCAIPAASVDEPRNGTTTAVSCGGPHLGDLVCNGRYVQHMTLCAATTRVAS